MSDNVIPVRKFCPNCGASLRAGARFCASCGYSLLSQPAPGASAQPAPVTEESPAVEQPLPESSPAVSIQEVSLPAVEAEAKKTSQPAVEAQAAQGSMPAPAEIAGNIVEEEAVFPESEIGGYKLTLESVPPQARGRVVLALRQVLELDPQTAGAYIAAAPVLLAVGLEPDMAEALRSALTNAGAVVSLEAPPMMEEPGVSEPAPEPIRRLERVAETVSWRSFRPGLRTVTGLDVGRTNAYLAYARADMMTLASPPEMVLFESRSALPAAIHPAREGHALAVGESALQAWVKDPQTVHCGLLEQVGENDDVLPVLCRFLETLAKRLVEVLNPSALAMAEGASTNLGVPASWDQGRIERLMESAIQAGFPVNRVAPTPLAALAHHLQQGTIKAPSRQARAMVIDWGGSSLQISFVEFGGELEKPRVFEHIEHMLGGKVFDEILYRQILSQIPADFTEEDERALTLFARRFKEQMSHAFGEGKSSHTQYCIIPPGAPPVRIRLEQSAFESLAAEELAQCRQALSEAVAQVGLKPAHLDHVILAGGGARWYFARGLVRETLNQVPVIGVNPEEAVARGLAVYRLTL